MSVLSESCLFYMSHVLLYCLLYMIQADIRTQRAAIKHQSGERERETHTHTCSRQNPMVSGDRADSTNTMIATSTLESSTCSTTHPPPTMASSSSGNHSVTTQVLRQTRGTRHTAAHWGMHTWCMGYLPTSLTKASHLLPRY